MIHVPVVRDAFNNKLTLSLDHPFPGIGDRVVDYNANCGTVINIDTAGVTVDWDNIGARTYNDIAWDYVQ